MRNPNPFTERQIRLLEAVRERIQEIKDPEPDVIRQLSYEWRTTQTKQFGKIPKVRFSPHCCHIKAELVRQAKLVDEIKEKDLCELRQRYGVAAARDKEARLFEAEWSNIMLKAKKAAFVLGYLNDLLAVDDETLASPVRLLQQIVLEEYSARFQSAKEPIQASEPREKAQTLRNKEIRPYDQELAELE